MLVPGLKAADAVVDDQEKARARRGGGFRLLPDRDGVAAPHHDGQSAHVVPGQLPGRTLVGEDRLQVLVPAGSGLAARLTSGSS